MEAVVLGLSLIISFVSLVGTLFALVRIGAWELSTHKVEYVTANQQASLRSALTSTSLDSAPADIETEESLDEMFKGVNGVTNYSIPPVLDDLL